MSLEYAQVPSLKTLYFHAVAHPAAGLTRTEKLVAFVIGSFMNASGFARPGRQKIADGAGIDVRSVTRALPNIEAVGLLGIDRSNGRRAHRYQATVPGRLWTIWPYELVTRLLDLGTFDPYEPYQPDVEPQLPNRDTLSPLTAGESAPTGTSGIPNRDIQTPNRDISDPQPGHQMSHEVVEVEEVKNQKPPSEALGDVVDEETYKAKSLKTELEEAAS